MINEYFKKVDAERNGQGYGKPYPRIKCADGFSFSVQAGEYSYCSPRYFCASYYNSVEVGFPSARDDALMDFAEDPSDPTETVYGYVPVEIVEEIIRRHGGMQP